jgi:hypothetical protein
MSRFARSKAISGFQISQGIAFLLSLPVLNNPRNLATARRRAAPRDQYLPLIPAVWVKTNRLGHHKCLNWRRVIRAIP